MTKAADFRSAASILRGDMEIAQGVGQRMRRLALVDGVGLTEGPYVETTLRAVMAGAIGAGTVATTSTSFDVATEFERRAVVCDQYTADMASFRSRKIA